MRVDQSNSLGEEGVPVSRGLGAQQLCQQRVNTCVRRFPPDDHRDTLVITAHPCSKVEPYYH